MEYADHNRIENTPGRYVSEMVAPGTPPLLGGPRGLTVRPGVGTALAAVIPTANGALTQIHNE